MVVALLAAGGLASALPAQGSITVRQVQQETRGQGGLAASLTQRGFQVNPGYPLLYARDPIARCREYTYPALKNCFGANPAAPYVLAVVKSWPNEYVERSTLNAFGPLRRGYSVAYRLHPREAIVVYGKMPPPGRYIGLQTYEWSRPGQWTANDY
jgi:hypothetical protein